MLIVGATSTIAHEVARRFARDGASLFLVGRDPEKLAQGAADLRVRGASAVVTHQADLTLVEQHPEMVESAVSAFNGLDAVLIAHGVLPDQRECEASPKCALETLDVNAAATVSLLTLLASYFERERSGTIAVITSVAGDRGRQSNYVYGAAKAAVTVFLQGLRNRLHPAGVRVLTVKPGIVLTPMTRRLNRSPLMASPERVGKAIYSAIREGRDVVYVPWFWRWIMLAVRILPEPIFKRMKL